MYAFMGNTQALVTCQINAFQKIGLRVLFIDKYSKQSTASMPVRSILYIIKPFAFLKIRSPIFILSPSKNPLYCPGSLSINLHPKNEPCQSTSPRKLSVSYQWLPSDSHWLSFSLLYSSMQL